MKKILKHMNEDSEEDFNKFIDRIKDKLDNNPELREEIESNVSRLSEIFETDVNINLEYYPNVENYKEIFKKYDVNDIEKPIIQPDLESPMMLSDLKTMLDDEDDLYLCIDPLYIKDGINDINDMLITTVKDRIILVPTVKKKK